jgi:hypothetical protein
MGFKKFTGFKYNKLIALSLVLMQSLWGADFQGLVVFSVPPPPPVATAAPAPPDQKPAAPTKLPLPGVTVTAIQGDRKLSAVSDTQGVYRFPDLPDGTWQLQVEMLGFTPIKQEIATGTGLPGPVFEMKMMPLDQIETVAAPPPPAIVVGPAPTVSTTAAPPTPATPAPAAAPAAASSAKPAKGAAGASGKVTTAFQRTDLNGSATAAPPANDPPPEITAELSSRAADGSLVNGSSMNGAASPYAQSPAFGNARKGGRSLYNGNLTLLGYDNSALDARPFSLTGQATARPEYSHTVASFTFGGPMKIPHLIEQRVAPYFNVSYQRTRNKNDSVNTSLMPDANERAGNFSQELNALGQAVQVFDPTTGLPFANGVIPASRISTQAMSLLQFYPAANFSGNSRYNYQVPLISDTHTDALRAQVQKGFKRKNNLSGIFGISDTRNDNNSQFDFLDLTHSLGMQATANYSRSYTARFRGTLTYQFSRQSNTTYPFFSDRENVSALAGIAGNNQQPLNWGPPSLGFTSGIAGLSDANAGVTHNQTSQMSYNSTWNHNRHNITFGGDFLFVQSNIISQSNPRGSFTFTGASTQQYLLNGSPVTEFTAGAAPVTGTGSDFAGFLLGTPDLSSIAFGNADKYFRSHRPDLFFQDDWRVAPGFTLNLNLRWSYGSPIVEKYGRLVNLDIAPGFASAEPVLANDPKGALTGQEYPDSLIRPDKHGYEPAAAFSWRPFPASSMVVRGGYSLRYNTQVYGGFANQMAQQSPLSTSLRVSNSAADPLSLGNGFYAPPNIVTNTFAVDPNFKIGYAQVWNLSVQRDLPGSLVMVATYTGIKGTHLLQAFLPNTFPVGGVNPCPACQSGYTYYTSGGNSEHEEGRMELRRRLHNGFTATTTYTYGKSIDDAASLGGSLGQPAQNWLNLNGERGRSSNDQRHLAVVNLQYTSGVGVGGGGLLGGWRGKLAKDWTFVDGINLGTGLPLTPICATCSTGAVSGVVRASYTGASIYDAPSGLFLNPNAVTAPAAGQWGNAGRNSITGPSQFSMNASMTRMFKLNDRFNLQLTFSATNPLNHVVYTSYDTTVNTQFGLPASANAMRSIQTTMRLQF